MKIYVNAAAPRQGNGRSMQAQKMPVSSIAVKNP